MGQRRRGHNAGEEMSKCASDLILVMFIVGIAIAEYLVSVPG